MVIVPLAEPVTLDIRATSLAKALPVLGKAYGVAMRASPAIGEEIVILSLKGAELPALRERLAAAFAGEWSVDPDGTLVFGPSARLRRGEERGDRERRLGRVRGFLAEMRKTAAETVPFTPEIAVARRKATKILDEEGETGELPGGLKVAVPGRRAFERIVARFRAEDLEVGAGGRGVARRVFSTRPTAMQRPFPFDPGPMLAQWAREEGVWRESDPASAETTPGAPALATLAVQTEGETLGLSLRGYDGQGRSVLEAKERLSLEREEGEAAPDGGTVRLAPTPESLLYARAFDDSGERRPLGEGTVPFLDASVREPLSFETTDLFLAVARATGRSFVGAPEDSPPGLLRMLRAMGDREGRAEFPMSTFAPFLNLKTPGWAVMRAESPPAARRGFYPRAALAQGLRMAYATDRPGIAELAAIAATVPDPNGDGAEPPLMALVVSLVRGYGLSSWPMLALLHDAGSKGGSGAFSEEGVRVGDLAPSVRARAERLAFGLYADDFRVEGGQDVEGEITTSLGGGFPAETRIFDRATGDVVIYAERRGGGEGRAMPPAAFARVLRGRDAEAGELDLDRLHLMDRHIHEVGLRFSARASLWVPAVTFGGPGGETYRRATLPPEIRAKVDAALVRLDARAREPVGGSGGAPPP